jgi:Arc/MetJ-type ribon-helix-helix transcriptional regulator
MTPMSIQITRPEIEALIRERLATGEFKDAEDVILAALESTAHKDRTVTTKRREAIARLRTFGADHKLSLAGMTIRELRQEARP